MKDFYFFSACFFCFLTTIYAARHVNPGCLEKEKGLTLLEIAENLLTKAGDSFPSCKEDVNSTNESECGSKGRSLAYIEISKKLISDVRRNFPTCSKPIEKDNKIVKIEKRRDCSEILASGHNESGVYTIWAGEPFRTGKPFQVYCDMETDKGGWTVIQRRANFSKQEDFYRGWKDYADGFGNITRDFWLGNENIYLITNQSRYEIRFDLLDEKGDRRFAAYKTFWLDDEHKKYTLHIGNYSGDAGDGMAYHNGHVFSTRDSENSRCARERMGGWWYDDCTDSNLNGVYNPGVEGRQGITWYHWHSTYSLAGSEIKLRRND